MIAIRNQEMGPEFVFASLLSGYPTTGFTENVKQLLADDALSVESVKHVPSFLEVRSRVVDSLGSDAVLDDLRSEYIDLFDRGREVNSLYETEYGRERAMVKGTELVDIAAFYRAFGLENGADGTLPEMLDHVSVELEFYALLVLKSQMLQEAGDSEGQEIVLDARKKFLQSHLGRFVGAICLRPGVDSSPFYGAVFRYCRDLVKEECGRLGVVPESQSWISGQAEPPEMACGATIPGLK